MSSAFKVLASFDFAAPDAEIDLPASWTIKGSAPRTEWVPLAGPRQWLVEVEDSEAPAELEGKILSPILQRHHDTNTVTVLDYGTEVSS